MAKVVTFGHKNPDTDSIVSAVVMADFEAKLGNEVEAVRIGNINKETKYVLGKFGVAEPRLIENLEGVDQVILVDHNEFGQSISGIESAVITKVVDHHRIENFKTADPIFYRAEPVRKYSYCII